MHFIEKFRELRLDIVGIVAILGEGSTSRNAQASALSWHHILPRIYPAPQSLLKHHQDKLLPVEPGIVVGAMSGRIRTELNFFTRLVHPDDLPDYSVQMLKVDRKPNTKEAAIKNMESSKTRRAPAMAVKRFGHLAGLSILGFCMSLTILVLALWQNDGAALVADVLLSLCSSFVGLASWCKLDVTEEKPHEDRKGIVPLGDVVIFYPTTGAFRVIRCTDEVSRFYFRIEKCTHYFDDNIYRAIALFSSAMLMAGLISLSNAQLISQAAFAAPYILLNALYWASSAINPSTHVWQHDFDVKEMGFTRRMIKDQYGKIVPQTSELSPASTRGRLTALKQVFMLLTRTRAEEEDDDDGETTIMNRSSQLYFNGNWKPDTLLPRVPTAAVVVQPGRHISLAPSKPEALGWNFAVNMNDILLETMSAVVVGATEVVRHVGTDPERGGNTAMPATKKPNTGMTSALWTVVALTGGSHWARSTNIAPNNAVR
ncbi:hypothetical protein LTS08_004757 [Lithohypha guttulata]|uniref:Uncharacterized protein n=1 Tax=Lithohypha guttulata TaxID=1690604 RepID=A0AAN7YIW3_9EURO|nr:hypothetical protein LTR05_002401 [Lithohypha guttulata]KAK5101151.1 hypothetical protein LTS08_004757 [Lithohypha guttulata]